MPVFASTTIAPTSPSYSDPLRAQSIKALEQRYKDMMAQGSGAITPENTATPIQGFGHLANQLGDTFQRNRVDQAAAAQRQALAQTIAQGPQGANGEWSPQQLAQWSIADPEGMKANLQLMAENRRAQAQREHEASQQSSRLTFEGGQKEQDRTLTKSGQVQQGELAREQMGVTKGEGEATRNLTRDMATQSQRATADLAQAEREVKIAEAEKDRALKTGSQQEQIAAEQKLEELRGRIGMARDAAKIAADAAEGEKTRASAKTLKEMGLLNDKEIAQLQIGSAERIQAEKAREAANMPLSESGKVVYDERKGKVPEGTAAAQLAPKPAEAAKQIELEQGLTAKDLLISELGRAEEALKGGINMGRWAPLASGIALTTQGRVGDLAQAQRTALFDSAMEKVATTRMSEGLKGQSTDYEMKKFITLWNNKDVSMQAKREAFSDLINAEKKNREIQARNLGKIPGANVGNATPGGAAAAPAPATATAPNPAAEAAEVQGIIDKGGNFDALAKRFQERGGDPSILKRKGP